jgi:hypothetical protein
MPRQPIIINQTIERVYHGQHYLPREDGKPHCYLVVVPNEPPYFAEYMDVCGALLDKQFCDEYFDLHKEVEEATYAYDYKGEC